MIYNVDIDELRASNVALFQVCEDSGSNWEAGYMDCLSRFVDPGRYYGVLGMATDIRLNSPPNPEPGRRRQSGRLRQSARSRRLQLSLGVVRTEEEAIVLLIQIREERESTWMNRARRTPS